MSRTAPACREGSAAARYTVRRRSSAARCIDRIWIDRIGRPQARLRNVVVEAPGRVLQVCVYVLLAERRAGFLRVRAPAAAADQRAAVDQRKGLVVVARVLVECAEPEVSRGARDGVRPDERVV